MPLAAEDDGGRDEAGVWGAASSHEQSLNCSDRFCVN